MDNANTLQTAYGLHVKTAGALRLQHNYSREEAQQQEQ